MPLEATRETGGCERLFSRIQDRAGRPWSVPLVPKVAQTTLRALGSVEHEPSAPILWIVRHPYLRVVSAWRFLTELEPWSELWPPTWPVFLRELKDADPNTLDRHLRPQVWFVEGYDPEKVVRLNLLSRHIAPRGFPRENQTDLANRWPEYTDEENDLIMTIYADDMAAFQLAIG